MLGQSWKAYYDSTGVYWNQDWEKCIELLEKALPLAAQEISHTSQNYMVLINDLGLAYMEAGLPEQALELFEQLVVQKREVLGSASTEYAASLINLGGVHQELDDMEQAEAKYLEAIAIYRDKVGRHHPDYATAIRNLGQLYETYGQYTRAEALYLEAADLHESASESIHPQYAGVLFSLGSLYRKSGDYPKSKEYFEKALVLFQQSYGKQHPAYAGALGELGILAQNMGQYTEAEKYLYQAVVLKEGIYGAEHPQTAEVINNLAGLYKTMGNYTKAEQYYLKAANIFRETLGEHNPEYATVLNNLGDFYASILDFDQAHPHYQQAAEILKENFGENHPTYANTLNNLASLNRKTGNFKQAEKLYQKTLEIDRATLGPRHPNYATSLNNLAILYVATGRYQEAEPLYREALEIKKSTLGEHHPRYARSLNNLALLYMTLDNLGQAEPLFMQAVENQLRQIHNIFPALTEKERESFYSTLISDLERFNTFAVFRALDNPQILSMMYNNQLSTKALLYNSAAKTRSRILTSNDGSLIADFGKWRALREDIARLYQLPRKELEKNQDRLQQLSSNIETLEKSLSQRSALFADNHQTVKYTWKDVRDALNPGEAAIEIIRFRRYKIDKETNPKNESQTDIPEFLNYGFTDEIFYAALIVHPETTDYPQLVLLENGQQLETRFLSYYKNAIHYVVDDANSYRQYWSKIADALPKEVEKVFLSPDGVYNKINLNTIQNPATKNHLIDDLGIYPVTNTKELIRQPIASVDNRLAVLLGDPSYVLPEQIPEKLDQVKEINDYLDPLPGTGNEVKDISKIMKDGGWHLNAYVQNDASEEMVKSLKNPRVLHIATHGYFSPEIVNGYQNLSHFNSGLLLSGASHSLYRRKYQIPPAPGEDGILTAYEAMNLNLDQTELVVLSACETGLGTVKNGEGVYGLQRAFKVAGAENIILSLWKVDDNTTQKLLTYFYRNWLGSGDKHQAFKEAQLKLREEYQYPYYWGAFIMVGS